MGGPEDSGSLCGVVPLICIVPLPGSGEGQG